MTCLTTSGNQGGEGTGAGGQWWIENIIEELDDTNEWYYDSDTRYLYYQPNATHGSSPSGDEMWSATQETELFHVIGSATGPNNGTAAKGITIRGLEMKDTAMTYLEPHGLPSGGDWALQRTGVVTVEGVENFTLSRCFMHDTDGIGVSING